MNSTIGIEYAYARIHKLEVEALAYKDKIAELEKSGNEMSIIISDLRAHLKIRRGAE